MKKLLAALVLTLSSAALAQTDVNQNTQAQDETKKDDSRSIETGVEATDVLPGLSGSKAQKHDQEKTDALMNKANAFNVNGTLKRADNDDIILSRQSQNLPDVELDVRAQTVVLLDGKKVVVGDIPEGAQVRASFQIDGDDAVALELKATSPKGAKKGTK
ncbi:hypothetical protein [Archangium lansingense]|uniref:Uncharacterized protein n=1 Tax=Archangium lansingense TaxID=2995310 RepID=A0ABT4ALL7_9BACT|nr:hypothetical protein [Archangium lansinium]MCY1082593.1 hypothetical protein [Archangium lansinium]